MGLHTATPAPGQRDRREEPSGQPESRPQHSTADRHGSAPPQGPLQGPRPIERLLDRLDAVKATGPDRWIARCPAHDDRSPSLSIREMTDGTLLLKCWTGCGACDVVTAAGLELRDLFPRQLRWAPGEGRPALRPGERWIPRDVLACLATEAMIAAVAADEVAAGNTLTNEDRERVRIAAGRLRAAAEEVSHARR